MAQFQRDDLACRQAVAAARSSVELQPRYGVAYIQCMYARGESVPTAPAYAYGYPYYPQYGYHRGTPVQPY